MSRKLVKTYPHLAEASNFELEFAEQISKTHPGWLNYAVIREWRGKPYLAICIPAPVAERELVIDAMGHRFTISFDRWHGHSYLHNGLQAAVQNIFDYAHAIMEERWIVVMTEYDNQLGGASGVGFGVYTVEQLNKIPVENRIYSCSWRGTYSEVYREFDFSSLSSSIFGVYWPAK